MEPQLEKIREVQKEAWNKASAGWKKWDDMMMGFLQPQNAAIVKLLDIKGSDHILDVATGTGEPGLTIASILKDGKVTGTDLAQEMLAVADENAHKRNIKNFETVCCDVSSLPFDDDTFDAVSCRLGFMFFPDMNLALNEMARVLKPNGHLAASVWSVPEKNPWISTSMQLMISMLQLTLPGSGAPGPFRCSQPGFMTDLFAKAGLRNLKEAEVTGRLSFREFETYWSFIAEVASPLALQKADDATRKEIKEKLRSEISKKFPNGNIALESSAIVICSVK